MYFIPCLNFKIFLMIHFFHEREFQTWKFEDYNSIIIFSLVQKLVQIKSY